MEKGEGKAVKKRRHKEFNNPGASSNKGKGDRTLLVRKYRRSNILGQKPQKAGKSLPKSGERKIVPQSPQKIEKIFMLRIFCNY